MKKINFISILVISMFFLFAGCSAAEKKKEALPEEKKEVLPVEKKELLPEKVSSVKVTYEQEKYKTTWNMKEDDIEKWKDWVSSLSYEVRTFEKGKTPADEKKGKRYTFDINNGEESFSYMYINKFYILQNKKWYLVTNSSGPLVMEKDKENWMVIPADSGEISFSDGKYLFKMKLLKGWKCNFFSYGLKSDSSLDCYEIKFYPEDKNVNEGCISIAYPWRIIAVCGTGRPDDADSVEDHTGESQMKIAGETATVKKYIEFSSYWKEITFNEKKKGVSIHNRMPDEWLDSHSEEVLEMLDTIEYEVKDTKKK